MTISTLEHVENINKPSYGVIKLKVSAFGFLLTVGNGDIWNLRPFAVIMVYKNVQYRGGFTLQGLFDKHDLKIPFFPYIDCT